MSLEKPTQEAVQGALEVLRPASDALLSGPEMVERAKQQVDAWFEMRAYVLSKIQEILVAGVDYAVIEIYDKKLGRKVERRSLGKAGAEKLAALPMFEFRPTFTWDEETSAAALAAGQKGWLCYWCDLHRPDGTFVGRGGGARNIQTDGGDLNKTRKMAQKSAYIDAVIRACGISDVVTQDMDEKPGSVEKPQDDRKPQPPPKETAKAPPAPPRAKEKQPERLRGTVRDRWIPPYEHVQYLEVLHSSLTPDERQKSIDWLYTKEHQNPGDWIRQTLRLMQILRDRGASVLEPPTCVKTAGIEAVGTDEIKP